MFPVYINFLPLLLQFAIISLISCNFFFCSIIYCSISFIFVIMASSLSISVSQSVFHNMVVCWRSTLVVSMMLWPNSILVCLWILLLLCFSLLPSLGRIALKCNFNSWQILIMNNLAFRIEKWLRYSDSNEKLIFHFNFSWKNEKIRTHRMSLISLHWCWCQNAVEYLLLKNL